MIKKTEKTKNITQIAFSNVLKGLLAQYYNCSEEELYIGDIDFSKTELAEVPYKVIFGNANFEKSKITNRYKLYGFS